MSLYTQLTIDPKTQKAKLQSHGVPLEVNEEVTSILARTQQGSPPSDMAMLQSAASIALKYSTFVCAQYALAAVILNGPGPYEFAEDSLTKAWNLGAAVVSKRRLVDVHYSASQGNSSMLSAGASLAKHMVFNADLEGALALVNRVIRWDIEGASAAKFVKAHVEQLLGQKTAASSLKSVASTHDPKAYYALGLEYLRRHMAVDAVLSFQDGLKGAPEVAELMLGIDLSDTKVRTTNIASAHQYVETFCLPEWSGSEIDALKKVVVKTIDSKW